VFTLRRTATLTRGVAGTTVSERNKAFRIETESECGVIRQVERAALNKHEH
jgi:hypothetical protein